MDIALRFTLGTLIFRWIEGKARLTPKFVANSPHCGKIRRFGRVFIEVCLYSDGLSTGHLNLVKLEIPHMLMPKENIRIFTPVPISDELPVSHPVKSRSLSVGSIIILEGVLSSWIMMCSRLPQSHMLVKKFRYTWSSLSKSLEGPLYGEFKHNLIPANLIWAVQVVELNNYGAIVSFNLDESEYANTTGKNEDLETSELEDENEIDDDDSGDNGNMNAVDEDHSSDYLLFLSYDELKYMLVINANSSNCTGMLNSLCRSGMESISKCENLNKIIAGCSVHAHGRPWKVAKTECSNFDLFAKTATLKPLLKQQASSFEIDSVDESDEVQITLSSCKDLKMLTGRSALCQVLPQFVLDQMQARLRERYPSLKQFTLLRTGSHILFEATKVAVKWNVGIEGVQYQLQSMHEEGMFLIRYNLNEQSNQLSDVFLEYEELENPIYELAPELPENFNAAAAAAAARPSCVSVSQSERERNDILQRIYQKYPRPGVPVIIPSPIAVTAAPLIKPDNMSKPEITEIPQLDSKMLGRKRGREEITDTVPIHMFKRQKTEGPEFEGSTIEETITEATDHCPQESACELNVSLEGNEEGVQVQYSPSGGVSGPIGSSRSMGFAKAAIELEKRLQRQQRRGQVNQYSVDMLDLFKGLGQIESQCAEIPPETVDPRPKPVQRNIFNNCYPSYFS